MQNKGNVVRLTEAELNKLVLEAAKEVINEGRFGDMAKRVGKGIAKGALYTALGTAGAIGGAAALDKGLENQERYEQSLNRQAAANACDPQYEYIKAHGLDPQKAESWREAELNVGDMSGEEYYNEMHPQNESKQRKNMDKLIESIVRNELKKYLG